MFNKAIPVFEVGKEKEMNTFYGFYTSVTEGEGTTLKITGSSTYTVWVNGVFVFSGPARAAHDFYRVDEIPLDKYLTKDENVLTVRLTSYNCNSYSLLLLPGFLCAEVVRNNEVLSYTDESGDGGFGCVALEERVQKVITYSFQRNFTETYRIDERYSTFDIDPENSGHRKVTLKDQGHKTFIPRNIYLPLFEEEFPQEILGEGDIEHIIPDPNSICREHPSSEYICFDADEVEYNCTEEIGKLSFIHDDKTHRPWEPVTISQDRFYDIAYKCNITGFFELSFTVTEECELHLLFDEIYDNENIIYRRMAHGAVSFLAKPGTYHVMTQEPYTFRYVRIACAKGSVKLDAITVRRAGYPELEYTPQIDDPELKRIYDAAVETFRQNTYDIYMDCPSRERAGWLCDSFFTSRVERLLTGKTMVEENFLGNFIDHGQDPYLPDGMICMCYPSDHYNRNYIPNWAMWFVLEMEEYLQFSSNREFVDSAKDLIYGIVRFFNRYKNSDGLLEKLEAWVFVEWSHANALTQDVNYPSNMLYARMLRAVANLYDDPSLIPQAEIIEDYIRKNTMVNGFFCDNSYRRENGNLELSGECTETCQYYAFFTGVATPESHPELWKILTTDFGPHRHQTGAYPEIHSSNAFIGNYLRLDLLERYGLTDLLLKEIRGYFLYMADKTGTLWENTGDFASCNHGFASFAAVLIRKALNV